MQYMIGIAASLRGLDNRYFCEHSIASHSNFFSPLISNMAISNQVNVRITDEDDLSALDEAVERYGKSRAQIFLELFKTYFEFYAEGEEARLKVHEQQRAHFQRLAGKNKK